MQLHSATNLTQCSYMLPRILPNAITVTVLKFGTPGTHKMLVRIANSEDPDQTASSEAV